MSPIVLDPAGFDPQQANVGDMLAYGGDALTKLEFGEDGAKDWSFEKHPQTDERLLRVSAAAAKEHFARPGKLLLTHVEIKPEDNASCMGLYTCKVMVDGGELFFSVHLQGDGDGDGGRGCIVFIFY